MHKWLSQKLGSTPTWPWKSEPLRWPPKPGTKILRWYLRTVTKCGLIRGLPASQIPHEKLLDTVCGMDCFLRKINFIAQHQNCLARHVFILDGSMKFYRKCSKNRRNTKAGCSTCQIIYVRCIKNSWGQSTWAAVRTHLLIYGESSYCHLSQEIMWPNLKPSILTKKGLLCIHGEPMSSSAPKLSPSCLMQV